MVSYSISSISSFGFSFSAFSCPMSDVMVGVEDPPPMVHDVSQDMVGKLENRDSLQTER